MKLQATQQLTGLAAATAATSRAARYQGIACASSWPKTFGGDTHGETNSMFVDLPVIATDKHRLRRPEDRSH